MGEQQGSRPDSVNKWFKIHTEFGHTDGAVCLSKSKTNNTEPKGEAEMWRCFEAVSGLVALKADWQRIAGEQFDALRLLCLQPSPCRVRHVPCLAGCGCNHAVIDCHDGRGAVGVCCCRDRRCPDIALTLQDITPLQ